MSTPTRIINLTQHKATPDQILAGVEDTKGVTREKLIAALSFHTLPTPGDIEASMQTLLNIMLGYNPTADDKIGFMVGGAPYLMSEMVVFANVFKLYYAFTQRVSIDIPQADGSVKKEFTFKHEGFVPVTIPSAELTWGDANVD